MSDVDLYSHDIDPTVTIEFLEGLGLGCRFPEIRGVATAFYAHQRFSKLPLQEAVAKYIEEEEERARNPPPQPVRVPSSVPEFIKEFDGVRCVDWDDDREGRLVCTLETKSNDDNWKHHPWNLQTDLKFTVGSVAQAKKVARHVLRIARKFNPCPSRKTLPRGVKKAKTTEFKCGPVTGLHFSGNLVFVSCDA